jgi:hypothetical protein
VVDGYGLDTASYQEYLRGQAPDIVHENPELHSSFGQAVETRSWGPIKKTHGCSCTWWHRTV